MTSTKSQLITNSEHCGMLKKCYEKGCSNCQYAQWSGPPHPVEKKMEEIEREAMNNGLDF